MSYKLIAKRDGYEIRQYGQWVHGWLDADGVYHEERGDAPLNETQAAISKHMEDLFMAGADAALPVIPQPQE